MLFYLTFGDALVVLYNLGYVFSFTWVNTTTAIKENNSFKGIITL